jgi:hypothetical protein
MLKSLWRWLACISDMELVSPQPLDECIRRIEERMNAPMSVLALAEARPVIGRFRGSQLHARRRSFYRNLFFLSARFSSEAGQTRISCRFSTHPAAAGYMTFWLAAVTLLGGVMAFAVIADVASHRAPMRGVEWEAIVIPVLMIAFGVGLVRFGRWRARGDREFLLNFLLQTVQARLL